MLGARTGASPARPGLLRTGAVTLALVVVGVLLAGPASAAPSSTPVPTTESTSATVVDPARPTARVVHGPNCSDGYVRVEVTNGTAQLTLTLQYDGAAAAAAITLAPGEQATLEGTETGWGVTVDVSVAVRGDSGAGPPVVLGTYTRPSQEDCDAITAPSPTSGPTGSTPPTTTPTTPPTTSGVPAPSTPATPTTTPPRSTPPTSPAPPPAPTSTGSTPAPTTTAPTTTAPPPGTSSSAGQVAPGGVLTIRGGGFAPGEQVTVSMAGVATPLATVTADADGRVEAVVQIPRDAVVGPALVQLTGLVSAVSTEVALDVAAREVPVATGRTPWPLMAAGLALLAVAVGLATAAARRSRPDDWQPPAGAAG